jgi:hypothetical protein
MSQGPPPMLTPNTGRVARHADFLRRSRRRRRVYVLAILAGLAAFVAIRFVLLGGLGPSDLNRLTPLWVFPLLFGANGLLVERLMRLVEAGEAADLAEAARRSNRAGIAGRVLMSPLALFRYSKYQSPWMATFVAAVFWSIVVVVLIDLAFPWL